MTEINVVVVETEKSGTTVCAFTDPGEAVKWFKKFMDQGKTVSLNKVSVDESADFIMLEGED